MEKELLISKDENDEIEIDLLELFRALKKRIWMILAAAVIAGGIAGAFSKFVLTPQFQSTSMVYILSKETTLTSLADLQIGSQLTQDYKIIVTSRPVLEEVIDQLELELDYEELREKIIINNPKDTRILSITAQDADPEVAKEISNAVAKTSSEYIADIMEMVPPKIIEKGVVAIKKSSPSNTKNALIGAALGMLIICCVIVLEVVMNDTVQTEEDVTKYLGITVLSIVPEKENLANIQRSKNGAKNRRVKTLKKPGGKS